MEIKDLVVTPLVIMVVLAIAYVVRPYLCDKDNHKYFFPALLVRVFGALFIGFLYQFYYAGGDTFNYHTRGSAVVHEIFMEDPLSGINVYLQPDKPLAYKYSSRILFYGNESAFAVVKIAALLDILTLSTYSATAVLFACFSFSGAWLMFKTFSSHYPEATKALAFVILFIPSVVIWGSGILKDTITLTALGWALYSLDNILIRHRRLLISWALLALSIYLLFVIKIYILLCFVPAVIVLIVLLKFKKVKNTVIRIMFLPLVVVIMIGLSYLLLQSLTDERSKYAFSNIATTVQVTAYDIAYWTGRNAGSTYDIGELDGTYGSMLALLPSAINVTLFRPYLWEINNILMFFSSMESFTFLLFTLYVLYRTRVYLIAKSLSPYVIFCLLFALVFAFAVGVSTFNFGTLSRYKIPMCPFYLSGLVMILENYKHIRRENFKEQTIQSN